MVDLTPDDMTGKLLTTNFSRGGAVPKTLSDPLVETPMVVTLDELRPYELDPRLIRNPLYDDIKASIRERGLDAPPAITRRPDADHYIIRNGGNTRLAILRELWSETRDARFFRITCLFHPWPERGDIVALTGHLAENELHSGLTFIERAIGVEKARELYELESGKPLTQTELARHLHADGYPISQPYISRMQEAMRYLLPCIPNVLYQGLGRPQIERLIALRKKAEFLWQKQANTTPLDTDFEMLFNDVLMPFDTKPDDFVVERVQAELIGQMAKRLGVQYHVLELDFIYFEQRQQAVSRSSPPAVETTTATVVPLRGTLNNPELVSPLSGDPEKASAVSHDAMVTPPERREPDGHDTSLPEARDDGTAARVQAHIVSPAASTDRLRAIQQLIADHTGESLPDFAEQALRAIPVQAGGLYPISDVWYIEPGLDSPERLRVHIAQFALEIAAEANLTDRIEAVNAGIGFTCTPFPNMDESATLFSHTVLALLRALSVYYAAAPFEQETVSLNYTLGSLLLGSDGADPEAMSRLSDNGLVKLFRLIRLARRLLHLEAFPDEVNA